MFWEHKSMLSQKILGSGKGENRLIRLGQGVSISRGSRETCFWCLCPVSTSLIVCPALRAECVVVCGTFIGVRAWEQGPWSRRQQTQGLLFEENFVVMCANKRSPRCHMVPACYSSIFKAHFILRGILLNHRHCSFFFFFNKLNWVSQRPDEKVTHTDAFCKPAKEETQSAFLNLPTILGWKFLLR